jgi:antitoxin (DNA-binding transcriptional repressor) of toxin-antitoxin stability system
MEVGIKEAKNNLSRYLKQVKAGEEIIITERGRPIARIVRENSTLSSLYAALAPLIQKGLIQMPNRNVRDLPANPVSAPGKAASDMVLEDRR